MDDTKIKEAFSKAKQDILKLKEQIIFLDQETQFLRQTLDDILYHQQLQHIIQHSSISTDQQTDTKMPQSSSIASIPAQNSQIPTNEPQNPAHQHIESSTPAQNTSLKAVITSFSEVSSGNRGVPADRQTDQQTDQHIQNRDEIHSKVDKISSFKHISTALETLDQAKKDIHSQFKRLTQQEMEVFTTIFTLEDQGFIVDYPLLAQKCSLTESSIRDYIQKLLKKGAPLLKTKENNKKILLKIAPELRKIASLPTIQQLRDL